MSSAYASQLGAFVSGGAQRCGAVVGWCTWCTLVDNAHSGAIASNANCAGAFDAFVLCNKRLMQMGDYNAYARGNDELGRAPLREVFDKPRKKDAFGNPFKVAKVRILML